jgi:hypothetical protein
MPKIKRPPEIPLDPNFWMLIIKFNSKIIIYFIRRNKSVIFWVGLMICKLYGTVKLLFNDDNSYYSCSTPFIESFPNETRMRPESKICIVHDSFKICARKVHDWFEFDSNLIRDYFSYKKRKIQNFSD